MIQRWAERRMYRRSLQLATGLLRQAARTGNLLEKIEALEQAEQKLKDACWLFPEEAGEEFEATLSTLRKSREEALEKHAPPAVERLLTAAEAGGEEAEAALQAAGRLLALLCHYRPEDVQSQELSARFHALGGERPPYRPVPPLSESYHRPSAAAGCVFLVGALMLILLLAWLAFR